MKKLFLLLCLFAIVQVYAQTFIRSYYTDPNALTQGATTNTAICGGNSNDMWVAGNYEPTTAGANRGISIGQFDNAGIMMRYGIIENSALDDYTYVPIDLIAVNNTTNSVIIVCQAFDPFGTLRGGVILRVTFKANTLLLNWERRYVAVTPWVTGFQPYNIVAQNDDEDANYWIGGEATNADFTNTTPWGITSSAKLLCITNAGAVVPTPTGYERAGTTSSNDAAETCMGLLSSNAGRVIDFTGRHTTPFVFPYPATGGALNMEAFFARYLTYAPVSTLPSWQYFENNIKHRMYGEDIIAAEGQQSSLNESRVVVGEGNADDELSNIFSPFMYSVDVNGPSAGIFNWYRLYSIKDPQNSNAYKSIMINNVVHIDDNYYILGRDVDDSNENCFMIITDSHGDITRVIEYPVQILIRADALYTDQDFLYIVGKSPFLPNILPYLSSALIKVDLHGEILGGGCTRDLEGSTTPGGQPHVYTPSHINPIFLITSPSLNTNSFLLDQDNICQGNIRIANPTLPNTHIQANELVIAPNPAKDMLNLKIPADMQLSKLSIHDLNGKEVFTKSIDANQKELELDITTLPAGMYILRAEGTGEPQVQKFIKN